MSRVSYGQYWDEEITIKTLDDEERFSLCMKLYKECNTVEGFKKIVGEEMYNKLSNSI